MNRINGFIRNGLDLAKTKTAKQTFVLFCTQIIVIGLGVITATLNARILGPKDYGILAFFGTVTGFTILFFRFGFFSSGGLLLAQEKNKNRGKELIGTLLIICLLIGLSYSLFIFISSFFVDSIFETNVNHILRVFSPILLILPFQMLIPQIGRGTNKIYHLAWFNVIPKSLYTIGIISILLLGLTTLKVSTLILVSLISAIVGIMVISYSFKPLFNNLKGNFKKIWQKNKEYGIHLYWGQIADQSTYKLDGIFISYFVNITQLGFYSLAGAITSPMAMLSRSLSTSLFKGFIDKERIPKKVIYYNFLWLSLCVIGLVLFGKFIITFFFTDKFLPVVPLILPLALAGFFQGMYQPYNMFLGAKGKKQVGYPPVVTAPINIFGNLLLIPILGAIGAGIVSCISTMAAYIILFRYYNIYTKGKLP